MESIALDYLNGYSGNQYEADEDNLSIINIPLQAYLISNLLNDEHGDILEFAAEWDEEYLEDVII